MAAGLAHMISESPDLDLSVHHGVFGVRWHSDSIAPKAAVRN